MPLNNNLYQSLLNKGFSKQEIHSALHKFMLHQIQHEQASGYKHKALHEKPSLFAKESHFLKSLSSAVISFLKTQFAKKPKNPV